MSYRFVNGSIVLWLPAFDAGSLCAFGLNPSSTFPEIFSMPPANPKSGKFAKFAKKKAKPRTKVKRKDPIFIDGARPRPMYVDYKDLELLGKLINRQGKILGRRKSGCTAASQHAVTSAIKRARFMALLPYVGE